MDQNVNNFAAQVVRFGKLPRSASAPSLVVSIPPGALSKDSTTGLPRSAKIARQDCHRQPRSANIAQEPQLKLVKIPNASQNAVFNPILRLFLPQNPGEPGINFKYTENFLQNRLKFQVY